MKRLIRGTTTAKGRATTHGWKDLYSGFGIRMRVSNFAIHLQFSLYSIDLGSYRSSSTGTSVCARKTTEDATPRMSKETGARARKRVGSAGLDMDKRARVVTGKVNVVSERGLGMHAGMSSTWLDFQIEIPGRGPSVT